jgi:hypothetical protein
MSNVDRRRRFTDAQIALVLQWQTLKELSRALGMSESHAAQLRSADRIKRFHTQRKVSQT